MSSLEEFVSGHDLDPLEVANSADYHYVLFVSFAEIYNNLVYDLLEEPPETGKHRPSLKIQQDRSQNNFIKGWLGSIMVCWGQKLAGAKTLYDGLKV